MNASYEEKARLVAHGVRLGRLGQVIAICKEESRPLPEAYLSEAGELVNEARELGLLSIDRHEAQKAFAEGDLAGVLKALRHGDGRPVGHRTKAVRNG